MANYVATADKVLYDAGTFQRADEENEINVSVRSYNNGDPKVRVTGTYKSAGELKPTGKLGSFTADEAMNLAAHLDKCVQWFAKQAKGEEKSEKVAAKKSKKGKAAEASA